MVQPALFNAFIIALILTTLGPIAIIAILAIKKKINGLPMLFGALAFFVSQMLLRIPLLSVLSMLDGFQSFAAQTVPYILFLSFTAGLFEESGRLGGALILKKKRSYKDVISFGLGHGLCEVILIVGLTHINNVIFCIAINNPGEAFTTMIPPETLETIKTIMLEANPAHVYLGILERVFAVTLHVFMTVLVFQGVVQRKWWYFILAILAHTLFNFITSMIAIYVNIYVSEAALLVMAVAAGWYAIKSKDSFPGQDIPVEQTVSTPAE